MYMSFMRIGYILPTRTYRYRISVWAILVARNVITLYCINTRTLYDGPSTTDVRTDTRSEHY